MKASKTIRMRKLRFAGVRSAAVLGVAVIAFFPVSAATAVPDADSGITATVTWRVHESQWSTSNELAKLEAFLDDHPIRGKLALFTCPTHVPPKLDYLRSEMPQLAEAIRRLKARGHRVGINHLCTIGQTDEDLSRAAVIPGAQLIVNWQGSAAKTACCPFDPVWREQYVKPVYEMLARTKPDFIWTDDDIGRLTNHGPTAPGPGCFCPACLQRVRDRVGYDGADVKGLQAFFTDPVAGKARRHAMLAYNRTVFADLLASIRQVVHAVDPSIALGVMDGPGEYEGEDFEQKYLALAPTGKEEVFFRPGEGFYNDLDGIHFILRKANDLGYESAKLPDAVAVNESEVESFPYQLLAKSSYCLTAESLAYIAAGVRGTAWNVFPYAKTETYEAIGSRIDACERVYAEANALVMAAGRARPRGVWNGRDSEIYVGNNAGGTTGDWLSPRWEHKGIWRSELQQVGIPVAYRASEADVCAPYPQAILSWTDEDLDRYLAGGLYLSVESLEVVIARGRGEAVGIRPGRALDADAREKLLPHPLNAGIAGYERDTRQSFYGGTVRELILSPGAQTVAGAVDHAGRELSSCVAAVYTNKRGGRVYVSGCFPWDRLFSSPYVRHHRNVFRWLSGERLAGYVDSYHKSVLWVRGDRAAMVFNASNDSADGLELMLYGPQWAKGIVPAYGEKRMIAGSREGDYTRYRVPRIPAWWTAGFVPVK